MKIYIKKPITVAEKAFAKNNGYKIIFSKGKDKFSAFCLNRKNLDAHIDSFVKKGWKVVKVYKLVK